MFRIIICTLFLLISYSISAQRMHEDVKISFADLELEKSSKVIIVSAFKVDNGYIVLKKEPIRGPGGFHYYIEKFDKDLVSQNIQDISKQFEKDDFVINRIIKMSDSYILISTKNFTEFREEVLYGQTLDWESGKLSKPLEIFTQQYEKKRGGIRYDIKTSNDEELLFLTIHPPTKRDEQELVTFEVYNSRLKKQYSEKDITIKQKDRNYRINETLLGDNGHIYLLGTKLNPKDRKMGIEGGPPEHEIITFANGRQKNTKIKFDEKFADHLAMTFSEDGTLYVGGYYRVKDGIGIDGSFLCEIDKETGQIKNEIWDEFSKEFITEGWSERKVEKANKKEKRKGKDLGLSNLKFRSVIKHDDGSISMVGEIYWVTTHTNYNPNGANTTTTTYHYGDLVVSKISKEGKFQSHGRVKKHHTYIGAYKYFNLNNEVAVLFTRRRMNLFDYDIEKVKRSELKAMDGSALVLAQVKENGEVIEKGIIDYKDPDFEGYRKYSSIGRNGFLVNKEGNVEFLILTYFGRKKWGLCKLDFPQK